MRKTMSWIGAYELVQGVVDGRFSALTASTLRKNTLKINPDSAR
jgi:hypothetical protein